MRLRELKFPIAVLRRDSLIGGRSAGLSGPSWFNINIASYYQLGGYDDAIIYDSDGREFSVHSIELRDAPFYSGILRLIGWHAKTTESEAWVDMNLDYIRTLPLDQFCNELGEIALAHPAWWKRHSDRSEIEGMFEGVRTFSEAIDRIGVLDPPNRERLPGKSTKVVDLRTKPV